MKWVSVDYGTYMKMMDSDIIWVMEKDEKKYYYALVVEYFDDKEGFLHFS
jgi:hypothetical protein